MGLQTIAEIIEDAKISEYLSANDVLNSALFPRPINKQTPQVIYTEYKSVQWAYNQNPNFAGIIATSNYLYWLCAAYNLQAIYIRTHGGGGSISPITPPAVNIPPIEFVISEITPIPNGGNTLSIPQYKGYNIIFNRGGIPQSQINQNDGSSYFIWNSVTGTFMCFGNAVTSELFSINPTI